MHRRTLDVELTEAITDRFELRDPDPDLATLLQLAACLHRCLGYDTTPKQRWALNGAHGDPPGIDPAEYWETFLAYGASGTCYATTLALDAYLTCLGFETSINAWDLVGRSPGVGFHHATNTVHLEGTSYLLETSSSVPHPLVWPAEDGCTSDPDGVATLTSSRGRVRLHVPRAAQDGTKVYELAAGDIDTHALADTYRDVVRVHPDAQRRLIWSRTRTDQVTASVKAGTYLLRDGHRVLHAAPVDASAIGAVLHRGGYHEDWIDALAALGAFVGPTP